MLYYLFDYFDREFDLIGAGVFQYISFRAGMAALDLIADHYHLWSKSHWMLQKKQVGETIRDLGLQVNWRKKVHLLWVD